MKFKIVLYLFLFVSVILIFQLVNTNKILNHQDQLIKKQNRYELQLKDSIIKLSKEVGTQKFFTYKGVPKIKEELTAQLLLFNTQKKLNQLIQTLPPQERFLINSIQLINDQWVLIGFRSDKNWGHSLLTYKKTAVAFDLRNIKTILYPL